MRRIFKSSLLSTCCVGLLGLVAGCSSTGKHDHYDGMSAEEIYHQAYDALGREDYPAAIKAYTGLESHYPFGEYTEQGQLDLIYAHYKADEHPAALISADKYIRMHPRSTHLDYVYYMKGLVKFNQNIGLMEKMLPLDPNLRDVSGERDAFANLVDFLNRYPQSPFAPDARQRLVYLRNSLAESSLNAGEYYFKRGAYVASANRALDIITNYDKTEIMPEALALLENSYQQLGLTDLAKDTHQVLALNYPGYNVK